jgi:hypothetical protein
MSLSMWVYFKGISIVLLTILMFGLFVWNCIEPYFERLEGGDWVMWYNEYDPNGNLGRKCVVLKKRKNH